MSNFNKLATSGNFQKELMKDMEVALKQLLLNKYPELSVRFKVSSISISPLSPEGWDLLFRTSAQVTPLDKKP